MHELRKLFFNHLDAWVTALIIATLALLLHDAWRWQTAVIPFVVALGYWFGFALNDYFDAPIDRLDSQKAAGNFFVVRPQPPRTAAFFASLVVLLLILFFARFGWRGWLLLLLCLAIIWAYSAPPLRIKSRPGWDLLVHTLFVESFPYLLTLILIGAEIGRLDLLVLGIVALASLTAQMEQQLRDIHIDCQVEANFTIALGLETTLRLLKIMTAALILFALIHVLNGSIPLLLLPFGMIGLPALLHRFWRGKTAVRSERLVYRSVLIGLLYTTFLVAYKMFWS